MTTAKESNEIWALEERLWTDGLAAYDELLAENCLMALPSPAGIMDRDEIVDSLKEAARWTRVKMNNRQHSTPIPDVIVLAYSASASRDDTEDYKALCTSTWHKLGSDWKLFQHQQTPVDADAG